MTEGQSVSRLLKPGDRVDILALVDYAAGKKERIKGTFSVGYLVGDSSDFPNKNYRILNEVIATTKKGKPLQGKIMEDCPICKSKKSVFLVADEGECIVKHRCSKCNREYEFFFCDDEIYRKLFD